MSVSHIHRWKRLHKPNKADQIRAKTGGRCSYCGVALSKQEGTRDHMVPRFKHGPSTVENLWLCCKTCNQRKAALDLEEFRALYWGGELFFFELLEEAG